VFIAAQRRLVGRISATLRRDFACVPLARGAKPSLIGENSPRQFGISDYEHNF